MRHRTDDDAERPPKAHARERPPEREVCQATVQFYERYLPQLVPREYRS